MSRRDFLSEVEARFTDEQSARRKFREAVIAARSAGISPDEIGKACGLGRQRIAKIVKEGPEIPRAGRPTKPKD